MAENKTKPTQKSVAAFIDALTDEAKRADAKALLKLMQSATGEKPRSSASAAITTPTRAGAGVICRLPVFRRVRPQPSSTA